jgi:hypothetical protein
MTAATVAAPIRVRDVLRPARGSADVGTAALSGQGRANRWRAGAAGALIVAEAVRALDEDLGALLVWGLEKSTALGEAGQQSRLDPATPQFVDLAQVHAIPASVTADLDVYVDQLHRATVTAVLTVEFGLLGIRAVVQGGWVTGVDGQQSVSATLKVESVQVAGGQPVPLDCTLAESAGQTAWAPIRLVHPVPLLGRDERSDSAAGDGSMSTS